LTFLLCVTTEALEPRDTPRFIIDFDKPANVRYSAMYEHFKAPLLEMENYWYSVIAEPMRDFYLQGNNMEEYQLANPDAYEALISLA